MSDPEKTVPPLEKLAAANKWADPKVDAVLETAKASAFTPWIIIGVVILLIALIAIVIK